LGASFKKNGAATGKSQKDRKYSIESIKQRHEKDKQ